MSAHVKTFLRTCGLRVSVGHGDEEYFILRFYRDDKEVMTSALSKLNQDPDNLYKIIGDFFRLAVNDIKHFDCSKEDAIFQFNLILARKNITMAPKDLDAAYDLFQETISEYKNLFGSNYDLFLKEFGSNIQN